ncbi:hypothetical protein [Paracoccus alkanivorans]|uniref:Lipoprotein n=1 Tax=Paracoccus alkanivorans TaxID=2116655 RepID=A0A3M0MAA2_9RHOB|nr:hypothetical protein [Paracoccus alkanivorans]RMC33264.1 hypothetical protein C9E81_17175 [Paracoccus alkanivorans]
MKRVVAIGSILGLLAACSSGMTPEQRSERAANLAKNSAIWKTRKTYNMEGATIDLAVSPDRDYALIWPAPKNQKVTIGQVERGVTSVTGCKTQFDGLLLMIAKGDRNAIAPFDKMSNMQNGLRMDLAC